MNRYTTYRLNDEGDMPTARKAELLHANYRGWRHLAPRYNKSKSKKFDLFQHIL
jgi:hypothetical protein